MRKGTDELKGGVVWNGFDYFLQVWVEGGVIQDCGHPPALKAGGCCNAHRLAGRMIEEVPGHENRLEGA